MGIMPLFLIPDPIAHDSLLFETGFKEQLNTLAI
jgi:hypothetical protein